MAHGHGTQAGDADRARLEIEHANRVLVDSEHPPSWQLRLHYLEPLLAEVAVPGVMSTALGIVVVGHDGHGRAERPSRSRPSAHTGSAPTL